MLKSYIKIAFRSFWRNKLFTLINLLSLSIGVSAALVIYLIVHFDFTFDKFHKDGDRIYRVVTNYTNPIAGYSSAAGSALPEVVNKQVTGIEEAAPLFALFQVDVIIPNEKIASRGFKSQHNIVYADGRYFKIFDYKWLTGSAGTALNEINQVVLTSDQAKKYFPSLSYNQMIGKIVMYDTLKTTITGIVQTPVENTDLTFHDFISYNNLKTNQRLKHKLNEWEINTMLPSAQYFVKVSTGTTSSHVEKQLNNIFRKNAPDVTGKKGNSARFHLQKLDDIHFDERYSNIYGSRIANKTTLNGLLVLATFLLLLGCINFINLSTAQAARRAREIGIRKTMGSSRNQLIFQFLSEAFFITLFAVILSVELSPIILKSFSDFIPAGIKIDFSHQPDVILFLIVLTIVVGLLSGFYPALVLSGYKPVTVLKNQINSIDSKTRNALLRKSLTVTQFIIAQFFIMAAIMVSKQIYYALHKDLGYKKDAIIIINTPWKNRELKRQYVFMNKLRAIPQVELVSMGDDAPSSDKINPAEAIYNDGKREIKTSVEQNTVMRIILMCIK